MNILSFFGRRPKEKAPATGVTAKNQEEPRMFELVTDSSPVPTYTGNGKTSFSKHLRWKLKTREVEFIDVSPEMAEAMLEYNVDNRPCSQVTVKKYAKQIGAGHWGFQGEGTCEPIIFSNRGRMLSGQHRLAAILEAKVTQRMLVVFGEPDENFAYIDQGRRRTAGDVFAINGVPNHDMAAAAVRWIVSYEVGGISGDYNGKVEISNQEAYEAYLRYAGLQDSIKFGQKFARDRLPSPSTAAAIHYLCARKSRKAADEYFNKVATGVGFDRSSDPAKKVRDFLTRTNEGRFTQNSVAAAVVAGWNAIRTNKKLGDVSKIEKVGRIV